MRPSSPGFDIFSIGVSPQAAARRADPLRDPLDRPLGRDGISEDNEDSSSPFSQPRIPKSDRGDATRSDDRREIAALGPGGFSAPDFELNRKLGVLSATRIEEGELTMTADGVLSRARTSELRVSIICYAATYLSGKPFQGPTLTLLREYPPGSKSMGFNELRVAKRIQGDAFPGDKYKTAVDKIDAAAPVSPTLGYFFELPSPQARQLSDSARVVVPGRGSAADLDNCSLFVVQKYEGLPPLSQVTRSGPIRAPTARTEPRRSGPTHALPTGPLLSSDSAESPASGAPRVLPFLVFDSVVVAPVAPHAGPGRVQVRRGAAGPHGLDRPPGRRDAAGARRPAPAARDTRRRVRRVRLRLRRGPCGRAGGAWRDGRGPLRPPRRGQRPRGG